MGRIPIVGIFLRDPSPYLRKNFTQKTVTQIFIRPHVCEICISFTQQHVQILLRSVQL